MRAFPPRCPVCYMPPLNSKVTIETLTVYRFASTDPLEQKTTTEAVQAHECASHGWFDLREWHPGPKTPKITSKTDT